MDGRAKTSTLYIDPAGFKVRAFGPSLTAGPEAAKITGLDAVVPREAFAAAVQTIGRDNRRVFVAAGSDVTGGGSRAEANGLEAATKRDPWDGRATRYEAFVERLRAAAGRADLAVENLDPIVDRARAVKSPREIAVIREATRIAGLGIMEAMREAEPGSSSTSCRPSPSTCSRSTARRARRTSRSSPPARTRSTRTTTRARASSRPAISCSSTTRPTTSTTSRTSRACSRPTASSRRCSASSTASTSRCIAR